MLARKSATFELLEVAGDLDDSGGMIKTSIGFVWFWISGKEFCRLKKDAVLKPKVEGLFCLFKEMLD